MQKGFQTVNLHGCASGVIATPVIGENGNWWIGNEDTGISAKGERGESGLKGDKGDKGATGAQGPQGIQGEKGATGEVDPAELERIDEEIAGINQSLNSFLLDYKNATSPFQTNVTTNRSYAALENGVLFLHITSKAVAGVMYATVENVKVCSYRDTSASENLQSGTVVQIPLSKGNVVSMYCSTYTFVEATSKFVPFK